MIGTTKIVKTINIPFKFKRIFDKIVPIANSLGVRLFVYGGFLRDLLSNKIPEDVDIYVENLESTKFTKILLKKKIIERKKDFIGTIPFKNIPLILSETKIDDVNLDFVSSNLPFGEYMKYIDFTIHSLIYDLQKEYLIDFSQKGIQDIKDKIIRQVTKELTPIEALRALKMVVMDNYSLDPAIIPDIQKAIRRLKEVDISLVLKIFENIYVYDPQKTKRLLNELNIEQYIPIELYNALL